jgi:uncharacterized protein YcgI (DUF1989 family)
LFCIITGQGCTHSNGKKWGETEVCKVGTVLFYLVVEEGQLVGDLQFFEKKNEKNTYSTKAFHITTTSVMNVADIFSVASRDRDITRKSMHVLTF